MKRFVNSVVLALVMLVGVAFNPTTVKAFQVGPFPGGGITGFQTWRPDYAYSIGQVVILYGVTYQSLTNNNLNNAPMSLHSVPDTTNWTNKVGTGTGGGGFPTNPGVVFNTSPTASRNATAGDIESTLGFVPLSVTGKAASASTADTATTAASLSGASAIPNGSTATTQTVGDNSNKLATDAYVLANAGENPGGADTQLQYNSHGTFAGAPNVTFNSSTGALIIGSPTPGTLGTSSAPMTWTTPFNNGSGTTLDTYTQYIQIGSGVNPFSQFVFDHPAGSPGGGGYFFVPPVKFSNGLTSQGTVTITTLAPSSIVCTDGGSNLATSGCTSGGGSGWPVVTPVQFGAHGDAVSIANGCTTNGTTTVVCPAGPFALGDVGKEIWITGAGASGGSFGSTIATFVSNTTITVAATPATNVTQNQSVFGHDDVIALQDCFNASAANNVPCVMGVPINFNTPNGYLIAASGLTIPTKANIQGSAASQATVILSEYNGDAISLPTSTASLEAGQPVEGVTLQNFSIYHDPSQPNQRGFHFNAAPGVYGFGGLFNSTIRNVSDNGAALECLWLDGHVNSDNNPNQYVTFDQFKCNGPSQSHPANEIKITGIQAQILFLNGSIDGDSVNGDYPNPLIWIGEKTSGQEDSPAAIDFEGFTYEASGGDSSHSGGGLRVGDGAHAIHFENGYVEDVADPIVIGGPVFAFTFKGNNVANSGMHGAVVQASDSVSNSYISATIADNVEWGSATVAAFAVCNGGTNNFNIEFRNNLSTNKASSNCSTNTMGTGAALAQVNGSTQFVTPSSATITTIRAPNGIQPGGTLTLYANGGSFQLGTGGTQAGNDYPINLGPFASPLIASAGQTVVLTLVDNGSSGTPAANMQFLVTGGTAGGAVGVATLAGNNVFTGTNEFTNAVQFDYGHTVNFNYGFSSHQNTYIDSNTGGTFLEFGPNSTPGTNYTSMWDDGSFHIDASTNTSRPITISAGGSGFNTCWRATASGANVLCVKSDGSLQTAGARIGWTNNNGFGNPSNGVITADITTPGDAAATLQAVIPVTDLNGGTSASSSTFWRGDGTWATPSGAGNVINICNGTQALGTPTIASLGNMAYTIACTGALTTDNPLIDFNGGVDPTTITGFLPSTNGTLSFYKWVTADTIHIKIVNNTASSITMGATTVNYRINR